jgi:hypothetical protein
LLDNMIPLIYGPAQRRPGTKYMETCGGISRVMPFVYSNTIAYIVLMEDDKFYFYYDGGEVLNGAGTRLTLVTPYAEEDLFQIQYKQSNDVCWLTHADYQPRKLTRTSAALFALTAITFEGGPFLTRNDISNADSVTMTPSVTTGTGTLTLSANTNLSFAAGHVGALFSVTQPRVATIVKGTSSGTTTGVIDSAIAVEGAFSFNTSGTWIATIVLQRSIDGSTWENYRSWTSNNSRNVQYTGTEIEDNIQYRMNVTEHTSGDINADLTVNSSTQTGICRITSLTTGATATTVANMTVVKTFASVNADKRWAEGCWSDYRGWPRAVTFYGGRVVYAGTTHQPQTVWFSKVDDFENFDEGVNDDDAFSLTMSSDTRCAIQWISASEALLVGTTSSEWRIRSDSYDTPLTPTNFSFKQQTTYGSKSMQALVMNTATLFVDYVGRKVREISYDSNRDKYVAKDLTALAEQITEGGIVDWDYQKDPDSILWAVTADGVLISDSYEPEQNVNGWAQHPLRTGDLVKSVAVIPGSTESEIWIVTLRSLDGSSVYCLEQMQPRRYVNQEDGWFVDCGLDYDSIATATITGLDHLDAEECVVLGDGAVFARNTPAAGSITLAETASRVIAGLPFRSTLKPTRFDLPIDGGTKGSVKKIPEIVASFYKTVNVKYGVDTDNLFTIDFRSGEVYGTAPALYTGDKMVSMEGGFDAEDSIIFTTDDPTPMTIRCLVSEIKSVG